MPHAEALEQQRGDRRGRAVRAVDDARACPRAARRRRRRSRRRSARPRPRGGGLQPTSPPIGGSSSGPSSASTRSSSASLSLNPSPPKSLMPLSGYGLWLARDDGAEVGALLAREPGHGRRRQHAGAQRDAAGPGDAGAQRVLEHRPRAAGVAADDERAAAPRRDRARTAGRRAPERRARSGLSSALATTADAVGAEELTRHGATVLLGATASRTAARLRAFLRPAFLRSTSRASRVRKPARLSVAAQVRDRPRTSALAMPWRSAPAWPEMPPPSMRARTSKCSARFATVSGAATIVAQVDAAEVRRELTSVDRDHARARRRGSRVRPTSCACRWPGRWPSPAWTLRAAPGLRQRLRLLGDVGVLGAAVDLQLA